MILHQGDCQQVLKTLPENSIDAIVTDPPYGLSFMNKKWDHSVPSIDIWKEALRVLKPGGHLLSFGGTRTYHRMVVNIEDAGFEIRDQIQWLYGSGFPKSHNIKEGDFKGFGTALKPANEPVCLARKPLEKGLTVAENVQKWGCGALNIDGCRIAVDALDPNHRKATGDNGNADSIFGIGNEKRPATLTQGRWPANIILDEQAAFDLDEQSGHLHGSGNKADVAEGKDKSYQASSFEIAYAGRANRDYGSTGGGASRFFYVAKASKRERNFGLDGMAKRKFEAVIGSTKNKLKRMQDGVITGDRNNSPKANHHPTVKPIKLMEYLCKLITPPNGSVLDPFMGSGSTGIAAKNLGFKFVGIEMNDEYFEIAKKRIS